MISAMKLFSVRVPLRPARALLAVGVLCGGLLGCSGLPSAPPPVVVYDFGPLPSRTAPVRPWRLAVDVRMPAWYEALPIDYRLDYDDPLLQRAYTGSRWAAAPASLIARQLRRQLGLNDAGTAVSCFLRVEVEEFVQVFAAPQDSRGVLNAVVTVLDERRRPLAMLPQRIEVPAATPDARGGVRALVSTANRLGENIEVWLVGLEGEGRLAACRPTPG